MKNLTGAELRTAFLQFFAEQEHSIQPSSSLVLGNDPTLLFTNAGMVQFKDVLPDNVFLLLRLKKLIQPT
jgi:alanyl-tRNA synthetase